MPIPLTYRITLEIVAPLNCHANPVPWIKPITRTGQLDRRQAVKQLDEAFATLHGEFGGMVRELRERQVRLRRPRR